MLRPALGEAVQTGAQDHVLVDAEPCLFGNEVLHEPGAGHDARPEPTGGGRIHVRTEAPTLVGVCQPETDLVVEDVGCAIDLDVQSTPEGDPYRAALRACGSLVRHAGLLWCTRPSVRRNQREAARAQAGSSRAH